MRLVPASAEALEGVMEAATELKLVLASEEASELGLVVVTEGK